MAMSRVSSRACALFEATCASLAVGANLQIPRKTGSLAIRRAIGIKR